MNLIKHIFSFLIVSVLTDSSAFGQEHLAPLNGNINYLYQDLKADKKTNAFEINRNLSNRTSTSISIPFKDDFYYAYKQNFPVQSLWSDSSTYVNTGHAIAPPSIGVATFDGLNKKGHPYQPNLLNTTQSLPADTLTSKPINLFTSGASTLQPSDSLAITFYYQARGFGDSPELTDTLLLDFYKPNQKNWTTKVWYARGNANANINDTVFKRGFVWISDTAYLQDGFKFRFRNKATTNGDFDHWHLDYVYLNKSRSIIADTTYDDIAFGYVPTPLLNRYSSMPWQQYINSEKAPNNSVNIRNNGDVSVNMTYENKMYDLNGNLTYSYTGGANPALKLFRYDGWSDLAPHAGPAFNHTFTPFSDSSDFTIKHYLYRSGPSNDFFPDNDTVFQYQRFRNYYAYDDGSAEAAYYVNGAGGKMVLKFKLNIADTLRALRIYFNPIGSVSLVETYGFRINLWSDGGNLPGFLMLQDSLMYPKYLKQGVNASPEYTLTTPLVLSPGEYYIGIQQKAAAGIGVGFDRNLNHMNYLYYDSGNGWTQSQIPGSLMMRPVFGAKIPPPVGIAEINAVKNKFIIYPNPANDNLFVESQENEECGYQLFNLMGQKIDESNLPAVQHQLNTEHLINGVYFIVLKLANGAIQQQKIIIQH